MTSLAAKSASLALLATGETEASIVLQEKAAIDMEEGFEEQSASIELESSAEREEAEAMAETVLAEEYKEEAVALHEKAVKDEMEAESSFEHAQELEASSEQLDIEAGQDLAAAETYEVQSDLEFDLAKDAEKLAQEAETRAAEDEGIVLRKEAVSAKDAEALIKTESGAGEDAELIAGCEVIPVLNVFCDIAGAIAEAGFQSVAAVEAAKSAIESISAATWSGKEREELLLASEQHSEAAKDVLEGERYQSLSVESGEKSVSEKAESTSLKEAGAEAETVGDEKLAASQQEEALSKFDEEEASRHSAEAAKHEALAAEEEAASIASELESEEHFEQSTAEEFESQTERIDAESKGNKARQLMEQSISHGMQALWYVISSILTAAVVIYIVAMKTLFKRVSPAIYTYWKGNHQWTSFDVLRMTSETLLHAGLILAVVATSLASLSNYQELHSWTRWKELLYIAMMVGIIECILLHCVPTICCGCVRKHSKSMIAINAGLQLGQVIHIAPEVLIELLILLTLFGVQIFNNHFIIVIKSAWLWSVVMSFVALHIWFFRLRPIQIIESTKSDDKSSSHNIQHFSTSEWQEVKYVPDQRNGSLLGVDVDKEYGSMEEVSLLTSIQESNDDISLTVNSSSTTKNISSSDTSYHINGCFNRLRLGWAKFCQKLHTKLDLLVLSLMVMLLYHSFPAIAVLHPVAVTSFAALSSFVSTPVLIFGVVAVVVIVHFVFVR